jgi:hypothetical protein
MPATTDTKGIASGWAYEEDDWGVLMNRNLRVLSALVLSGFGQNILTTSGLTYGYRGGVGLGPAGIVPVAGGTVTLPPNATSYIIRTVDGTVTSTTNPSFPTSIQLATVVTNISGIISVEDTRYIQDLSQNGTLAARFFTALDSVSTPELRVENEAAVPDVRVALGIFNAGANDLGLAVIAHPSGTVNDRYVQMQVGDEISLRDLALRSRRLYVGREEEPAFVDAELVNVRGQVCLSDGGASLQQRAGSTDFVTHEFYARTATPTIRSGYHGYLLGSSTQNIVNEIGVVQIVSNDGSFVVGAGGAACSGPLSAPAFDGGTFEGSGAALTALNATELTTGTIPAARYGAAFGWSAQSGVTTRGPVPVTIDGATLAILRNNTQILADTVRTLILDLTSRGVI